MFFRPFLLATFLTFAAASAMAQNYDSGNDAVYDRMDRMERDLMLMQRQVSRSGSGGVYRTGDGDIAPNTPASGQIEVRLQQMEEQMRKLEGQVEESKFQAQQAQAKLEKVQKDLEFRLNALEQKPAAPLTSTADPASAPKDLKLPKESDAAPATESPADASDDEPAAAATPRDAYNHAFKLLRESKHEEAGKEFDAFVKKYPKDALTGNAYYWMGESYYVRRDYAKAADSFRLGYKAAPTGAKASDNLLKLAMSLSAMKKPNDACVVLAQVVKKFGAANATAKEKAMAEMERNRCA